MSNPNDEKEITRYQLLDLGLALVSLAEAMTGRDRGEVIHKARRAVGNINAFLGAQQTSEPLTEKEASWSAGLHTWLRKYEDSHLSCILYNMISESRADPVWYAFIRALVKKKNIHEALSDAREVSESGPTDWMIFDRCLWIWHEQKGLLPAVEQILEWEKEDRS